MFVLGGSRKSLFERGHAFTARPPKPHCDTSDTLLSEVTILDGIRAP